MAGSDAVIGLPAFLTALEYDMDDYSTPVVALEQVTGKHAILFYSTTH